jgi:ribosomal protein S12 methylthiotransferase accessory factor
MGKIELKKCLKGYTYDQDKVINPEETVRVALERAKRYKQPLISEFVKVNNRFNIPIYHINSSVFVSNKYHLGGSNGKGAEEWQSKASCVMEFIERFSAKSFNTWTKAKYNDIAKDALPIECIANTLNYNYPDRGQLISEMENLPIEWGSGYDLTNKREIFLPKLLHTTYTTGLAAGNTMEEAINQALSECVERHVGALVQWQRREYATIDKNSIESPVIKELIDKIESKGVEVIIKDFSEVMDIPVLGAIAIDRSNRDNVGQAIGVCPDREKALVRALTEVVQGGIKGHYASIGSIVLKNPTLSFYFDNYKDVEYLVKGPVRNFCDVPDLSDQDMNVEIERYIDILRRQGRDVMALDMTSPVLEIPSVWAYMKNAYISHSNTSFAFHVAAAHFSDKNYERAMPLFQRAIELDADKTDAHTNMGLCYESIGQCDKALEHFRLGLESANPVVSAKKEYFHYHIGLCCLALNRLDEAEASFEKALTMDDNEKGIVYFHLGLLNERRRDYKIAIENYERTLGFPAESGFDVNEVYFFMGRCYVSLKDYGMALAALEKAKSWSGHEREVYFNLGVSRQGLGQYEEAVKLYEQAYKQGKSPSGTEMGVVRYQEGLCWIALNEYGKAEPALKQARELGGESAEVELNLGICLHEKKDYPAARAAFELALNIVKDGRENKELEREIRFNKGISAIESGDFESGICELEQVKSLGGLGREVRFNLGLGYENAGRYKEALAEYEAAIKGSEGITGREAGTLHLHKGICQMEAGDVRGARESVREAIKQNTEALENYNMLGSICRALREPEQGIEAINEGLSRGSGSRSTRSMSYRLLGVMKRETGRLAEAEENLNKAITEDTSEWSNYNVLGNIYRESGRESQAQAMYLEAEQRAPESYKPKIREKMKGGK